MLLNLLISLDLCASRNSVLKLWCIVVGAFKNHHNSTLFHCVFLSILFFLQNFSSYFFFPFTSLCLNEYVLHGTVFMHAMNNASAFFGHIPLPVDRIRMNANVEANPFLWSEWVCLCARCSQEEMVIFSLCGAHTRTYTQIVRLNGNRSPENRHAFIHSFISEYSTQFPFNKHLKRMDFLLSLFGHRLSLFLGW